MILDLVLISLAGVAGTALMTGFLYALSNITNRNYKVVKILGNMLTNKTWENGAVSNSKIAITTGLLVHYLIGILFAISFLILWQNDLGKPDLLNGVVFGIVYGVFAVIVWFVFFKSHPNPADVPLVSYLLFIFLGHVLFSLTTVYVYRLISEQI